MIEFFGRHMCELSLL